MAILFLWSFFSSNFLCFLDSLCKNKLQYFVFSTIQSDTKRVNIDCCFLLLNVYAKIYYLFTLDTVKRKELLHCANVDILVIGSFFIQTSTTVKMLPHVVMERVKMESINIYVIALTVLRESIAREVRLRYILSIIIIIIVNIKINTILTIIKFNFVRSLPW